MVYDVLNGGYIRSKEREIIGRQLKLMDSFECKKPKELLKGDGYNGEDLEEKIKNEK